MKTRDLTKTLFFLFFILVYANVNAQAYAYIDGPVKVKGGTQHTYSMKWMEGGASSGQKQIISFSVEGGTIVSKNGNIPSVTIMWNDNIAAGKVIAYNVIDVAQQRHVTKELNITFVKDPCDPENPNDSRPLVELTFSNKTPKQFEFISIEVLERYAGQIDYVTWIIDGQTFKGSAKESIYFPTTGRKSIVALVHLLGCTKEYNASTVIEITPGNPVIEKISGHTKLGVGSEATYSAHPSYSTSDVEYIWSIWKNTTLWEIGNQASIAFLSQGYYVVNCSIKDLKTGFQTNKSSLEVNVSLDYGVLNLDELFFKVIPENQTSLRIVPRNIEFSPIVSFNSKSVFYQLCNMSTGAIVNTGHFDKKEGSALDINSLPKGIYVLYLEIDHSTKETHKISLK